MMPADFPGGTLYAYLDGRQPRLTNLPAFLLDPPESHKIGHGHAGPFGGAPGASPRPA
jgi:hypothetical protein